MLLTLKVDDKASAFPLNVMNAVRPIFSRYFATCMFFKEIKCRVVIVGIEVIEISKLLIFFN